MLFMGIDKFAWRRRLKKEIDKLLTTDAELPSSSSNLEEKQLRCNPTLDVSVVSHAPASVLRRCGSSLRRVGWKTPRSGSGTFDDLHPVPRSGVLLDVVAEVSSIATEESIE